MVMDHILMTCNQQTALKVIGRQGTENKNLFLVILSSFVSPNVYF